MTGINRWSCNLCGFSFIGYHFLFEHGCQERQAEEHLRRVREARHRREALAVMGPHED